MSTPQITFIVFTKPWKTPLPQLGAFLQKLGFNGVELPIRPGYQVTPESMRTRLPEAAHILADCGLTINSIAGPTDETMIALCAELKIPIIRICLDIPEETNYLVHEEHLRREFDALVPLLDRYGVTLGIQNHSGRCVANAMGLLHLIEKYDRKHVAAVLDPAHCALNGEIPDLALDIVWSHLCLVNLKNVLWQCTSGPEAPVAAYTQYWTSGRHGLASWERVTLELKRRNYSGPICLTAEYSDEAAVDRLITEDIAYAKSLFV